MGDLVLQRDAASGAASRATLGTVAHEPHVRRCRAPHADHRETVTGAQALDLRYAYDLRGRVSELPRRARAGGTPVRTVYAYDTSGRLADVAVAWSPGRAQHVRSRREPHVRVQDAGPRDDRGRV